MSGIIATPIVPTIYTHIMNSTITTSGIIIEDDCVQEFQKFASGGVHVWKWTNKIYGSLCHIDVPSVPMTLKPTNKGLSCRESLLILVTGMTTT